MSKPREGFDVIPALKARWLCCDGFCDKQPSGDLKKLSSLGSSKEGHAAASGGKIGGKQKNTTPPESKIY
ncbi:hypothetical protein PQ465_20780 [Sphingobacterium oryzagri]|uniref:Uncharacterized protein n=1 Tax=Sphingobacterium oryzagri TaxID=3025669 RepID=A0ABY7WGQ6_9SPHI|nr:hypothetical protein [Sphingobacterium sp. KACC 22765]WDF68717.1 hypothetical protein PQ465_20780 [Sphingobacterium sp. KACC 22765]